MTRKSSVIARQRCAGVRIPFSQYNNTSGFTLAELLVSVFILAIIILLVAQLMNNAAAITNTGNKHITTDTQARTVFDRMAVDFAQMLKRTDIDYYIKGPTNYTGHGNGHGWGRRRQTGQQGSDQIAFYSQVPGYYPATASQSPISLVAYRVNQGSSSNAAYLKLERLGKGLLWNGVDTQTNQNGRYPIIFSPGQIAGCNNQNTIGPWAGPWSAAICNDNATRSNDSNYEVIAPGVFRFEYYYLLKNGKLTDVPWDTEARPSQTSLTNPVNIGLTDVESITMAIAVVDSAGRALIDAADPNSLDDLGSDLADFRTSPGRGVGGQKNIGDMEASWQTSLLTDVAAGRTSNGFALPAEAAKAIRIYSKTFDLRTFP